VARYIHGPSHYLGVIFPDEQDFMMMRLKFHRMVKIVYVFNGFNWEIRGMMSVNWRKQRCLVFNFQNLVTSRPPKVGSYYYI